MPVFWMCQFLKMCLCKRFDKYHARDSLTKTNISAFSLGKFLDVGKYACVKDLTNIMSALVLVFGIGYLVFGTWYWLFGISTCLVLILTGSRWVPTAFKRKRTFTKTKIKLKTKMVPASESKQQLRTKMIKNALFN